MLRLLFASWLTFLFNLEPGLLFRFLASNKSQVETIDEEVFRENQQEDFSDVTDSCHGDNDPEPENGPSEGDAPSELNENIMSFAAMHTMTGAIGSWRSGTSSVSWSVVCDNFPQLHLLLGFLKVRTCVNEPQEAHV